MRISGLFLGCALALLPVGAMAGGASLPPLLLAAPPPIGSATPNSGAFTTLSTSGAATIGGTLGVTGAINTTSPQGYQQSGATVFNTIPGMGGDSAVLCGPYAGASLPNPITYGMVACGPFVLGMETNGGAETVAIGPATFAEVVGQFGNTGVGEHVGGFDPAISYATMGGLDSGRDAFGLATSTTWGALTLDDGQMTGPNSVFGALSLRGSAGGIKIAVSSVLTVGDALHVSLTTTGIYTVGAPATATFTIPSSPTLSIVANGIASAINATGMCYNSPQPAGAPPSCTPIGTNVSFDALGNYYVSLHMPGGNTAGMALTMTTSCTGACGETLTVLAPFTGMNNAIFGIKVLNNPALTTASNNALMGDYIAQNATDAFSANAGIGFSGMNSATNDSYNAFDGDYVFYNAKGLTYSVGVGYKAGFSVGTGSYDLTLLGNYSGGTTVITGHDIVLAGTNNQCTVPTAATANFFGICTGNAPILFGQSYGSIQNSIVQVTGDFVAGGNATALAASATVGFTHLPWSTAAPTGIPGYSVASFGPACEINTATQSLNCYIGSSWYHLAMTAGAN